ncbi:MAG TPA: ATP-binding protein [Herpetosiphonaceae bacterium]|nr:ATP-binding protein [Herpetosiphonaceae bacterium]
MHMQDLIGTVLHQPTSSISYAVNRWLAETFAGQFVLLTTDGDFDLRSYAQAGLCACAVTDQSHPELNHIWLGEEWGGMQTLPRNAWQRVTWEGHTLTVLTVTWMDSGCEHDRKWIIAPERATAEAFFIAVCAWNGEVRQEILVFEDGGWSKSEELFEAIQSATFDSLVLGGTLKQDILNDARDFFAAEEIYTTYGVPWKRGILLIGSPGNGKTHTVKALINELGKPCLYVKNFDTQYSTPSSNMSQVFQRARKTAPCVLVMEDLDALITEESRSFFLNEVDGFAVNHGILLLATTNHPERIDSAIMNRPSRFDRKYHFELPGLAERRDYIALWNESLRPATRLSPAGVDAAAEHSEGFSFAYLKELFLSALMSWISTPQEGAMDARILDQIALLREQTVSLEEESAE